MESMTCSHLSTICGVIFKVHIRVVTAVFVVNAMFYSDVSIVLSSRRLCAKLLITERDLRFPFSTKNDNITDDQFKAFSTENTSCNGTEAHIA